MTTMPPGSLTGKQLRAVPRKTPSDRERSSRDRTRYPDWEPVGRSPTETAIVRDFEPMLVRYLADRGIVAFVGSDNFFYYIRGNNKMSVSPDVYTLLGLQPDARPMDWVGSNNEGCWKTWLHQVVPSFALEVKALHNPRKDELQSPPRHDALGTKELIVFDPFAERRQKSRKRFCVYRRDPNGVLQVVVDTDDDRVYSEELQAFLVVQGRDGGSLLRLGVGPNGDDLIPFEHERADQQTRRANAEALRADEEARRADEAVRARQEETQRANEEARKCQEETQRTEEANRRVGELEAELARLKASLAQNSK